MTNKSLEALEELCSRCYVDSEKCSCHARYQGGECYTSCKYKDQIKQDLEHLVQLEKENKEVKIINDWLKEDISQLKEQLEHNNKTILTQHNLIVKYKKAIKILTEKRVNIDYLLNSSECPTYNFYADDFSDLTQQEYELLKEVLDNDK